MSFLVKLVYARRSRLFGRAVKELLALYGVEIPAGVEVGSRLRIAHHGFGLVVDAGTRIGDRVMLYPGVSIGRSRPWIPRKQSGFIGVEIGDDVVLCPGAKIACPGDRLRVANGCVIGANAVLTESTGEWEIWAGAPARRVGYRDPQTAVT